MINANVILITTPGADISRPVYSFIRQSYVNKTLHVFCVGGEMPTPPEMESTYEDIRIYNLDTADKLGGMREIFNSGYVFYFHPDKFYLPWHLTRTISGWTKAKRRAYSSGRQLVQLSSVSYEVERMAADGYTTLFQANDLNVHGISAEVMAQKLHIESQIEVEEMAGTPSVLSVPGLRLEDGAFFKDYGGLFDAAVKYLRDRVTVIDAMIPRTSDRKVMPGELTQAIVYEIQDLQAWVSRNYHLMCVITDDHYHIWQTLVMLHNFRTFGLHKKVRLLVFYQYSHPNPMLINSLKNYFPDVQAFYYRDEGANIPGYKPCLRPHTLRRHWEQYPELKNDAIFYHDVDILFTRRPNFEAMASGPDCYVGDCRTYLGSTSYILKMEKGMEALTQLAGIVGIDPQNIIDRDQESGGAQYILKDITADFWAKVEKDCVLLYKAMNRLNSELLAPNTPQKKLDAGHTDHIQAFCADMWAVLWGLWAIGKKTPIHPDVTHTWATDEAYKWPETPIMHNAGVTEKKRLHLKHFSKTVFVNEWPEHLDLSDYSPLWNSFNYAKAVKEFFDWAEAQKS